MVGGGTVAASTVARDITAVALQVGDSPDAVASLAVHRWDEVSRAVASTAAALVAEVSTLAVGSTAVGSTPVVSTAADFTDVADHPRLHS